MMCLCMVLCYLNHFKPLHRGRFGDFVRFHATLVGGDSPPTKLSMKCFYAELKYKLTTSIAYTACFVQILSARERVENTKVENWLTMFA